MALGFRDRWAEKLDFLRFMNLDVIGDQDATWKNHAALEAMGLKPLAIVTSFADEKHLHRALEYDYIALGGLVPYTQQKDKLRGWLDRCFRVFVGHYKKTGVMPKVHLLGVSQKWVLERYPVYSSDSSSWVRVLRFGGGRAAGIKRVPKVSTLREANLHVLRAEIKKYQRMERDATKLWANRGVSWND